MNISKLAVASLESPLLMRIQISEPNVVNYHVFDQSVPINANLHINLFSLILVFLYFVGNKVFFNNIETLQLFVN